MKIFQQPLVVGISTLFFISVLTGFAQAQTNARQCQERIDELRNIYIVILRKIPAMPPLAQLSSGIQSALNEGESLRDQKNYSRCVSMLDKQIEIVRGYAR